MANFANDYVTANQKLENELAKYDVSTPVAQSARMILSQVEHIQKTMPQIPIIELTEILNSVCFAVIHPSPESALDCWKSAQAMLARTEPEPRTLGQNLLLMAGICCTLTGIALLIASEGTLAPAASALFIASKVAFETSRNLPTSKKIEHTKFLEFKQYLSDFRMQCQLKEEASDEQADVAPKFAQ